MQANKYPLVGLRTGRSESLAANRYDERCVTGHGWVHPLIFSLRVLILHRPLVVVYLDAKYTPEMQTGVVIFQESAPFLIIIHLLIYFFGCICDYGITNNTN